MRKHPYNCPECGKADTLTERWYQRFSEKLTWKCPNCQADLAFEVPKDSWMFYLRRALLAIGYFYIVFLRQYASSGTQMLLLLCAYMAMTLVFYYRTAKTRRIKRNLEAKLSKFEKEELSDAEL